MLTGQNGILTQAQNAKEKTDKTTEEEKIQMAVLGSSVDNNGYVDILDEISFKQELANQFENQELDVHPNGDGSFIITVNDTQRKYYVNDDKTVINSDNIVEISDEQGLIDFRNNVNNGNSYEGKAVLLTADNITLSGEWEPIGYYSPATEDLRKPDVPINKPFRGIFDGGNNEINGININSDEMAQGLFGLVIDGTIRNVVIGKNSNIDGNVRIGSVVGFLYGDKGNISNCVNYAKVAGEQDASGGIVGQVAGQHTIYNCKNYGDITGLGGIVGSSNSTTGYDEFTGMYNKIINCGNYGNVTRITGNYCGGIVGYFNGKILNCYNKANIVGDQGNVGGIAGSNNGEILNCYSIGDVSGQYSIGGIMGYTGGTIGGNAINCYSIGTICGNRAVGDIIGALNGKVNPEIVNCYTKNDTFTASNLGDAFKEDTGENGGYPMLYWE